MNSYRFGITPISALGTPIRSDTLSGHLLCLFRERHGEERLLALLEDARSGEVPFSLSDAFPRGRIPQPLVPPLPRQHIRELVEQFHKGSQIEAMSRMKQLRKNPQPLTLKQWQEVRGSISARNLYFITALDETPASINLQPTLVMHNTINRHTGTVLDKSLHVSRDLRYPKPEGGGHVLDIYAQVSPGFNSEFKGLLEDLENSGYGRDRSSGLGQLQLGPLEPADDLFELKDANAWLNLSTFSTVHSSDLKGAFYNVSTKFGKVWNGFGEQVPFKLPLMVFSAGSTFRTIPNLQNCIISGVHRQNPNIVQYCAPVLLPFRMEASK